MNEFERALAKTDKREQRKTLTMPKHEVLGVELSGPTATFEPAPKEKKPSMDGLITVMVVLPYDTFEFTLTKQNVLGMKKLVKGDFERAIRDGLKSILGNVR